MNTVAEFVALERLEYSPTSAKDLMKSANVLRDQSLADPQILCRDPQARPKNRG